MRSDGYHMTIVLDPNGLDLEVAIGRAGLGWAGPTLGRTKTGPGQNWPGFFGPKF